MRAQLLGLERGDRHRGVEARQHATARGGGSATPRRAAAAARAGPARRARDSYQRQVRLWQVSTAGSSRGQVGRPGRRHVVADEHDVGPPLAHRARGERRAAGSRTRASPARAPAASRRRRAPPARRPPRAPPPRAAMAGRARDPVLHARRRAARRRAVELVRQRRRHVQHVVAELDEPPAEEELARAAAAAARLVGQLGREVQDPQASAHPADQRRAPHVAELDEPARACPRGRRRTPACRPSRTPGCCSRA